MTTTTVSSNILPVTQINDQKNSKLFVLPEEILTKILSFLPPKDVGSFYCTSHLSKALVLTGIQFNMLTNLFQITVSLSSLKNKAKGSLALALADSAQHPMFEHELVLSVKDSSDRKALLEKTVPKLLEKKAFFSTYELIKNSLISQFEESQYLAKLVDALLANYHIEKAEEVYEEITDPSNKLHLLLSFAQTLANDGQFDKARRLADSCGSMLFSSAMHAEIRRIEEGKIETQGS